MMRKKRLFALALAFAGTLSCFADVYTLVVELTSGEKDKYVLSDKPVVTFSDGNLLVKSEKAETQVELPVVFRCYFETGTAGMNDTVGSGFSFSYLGEDIIINGANRVELYNVSGMKLTEAGGEGTLRISLSGVPEGVYIIKTNNKTIKIKK